MKKAFTLVEVLITLGIIGIVSALTIPSLVNNIQDKHFKALWKKMYSDINNVYQAANQEEIIWQVDKNNNLIGDRCQIARKAYYEIFSRLKTTSFCVTDESKHSCDSDKNYRQSIWDCNSYNNDTRYSNDIDGRHWCYYDGWGGYAMLANGGRIYAHGCLWEHPMLVVDVNGDKKPNTIGRDLFVIYIKEKIIPAGAPGYEGKGCDKNIASEEENRDAISKSGSGCGYHFLYE